MNDPIRISGRSVASLPAWASIAIACLGCAEAPRSRAPTPSTPAAPPNIPAATIEPERAGDAEPTVEPAVEPGLEPLEGEPFVDLELSWGEPALIAVPLGARGRQPVLVATHGAGGRADYHCQLWRRIVGATGFIVCPRGYPMNRADPQTGYFYDGHPALGREIEAALAALRERFDEHVDLERPIFTGYSQGASMGALILPKHPARFARAVLWEGGVGQYQEWNVVVAEHFGAHGAERVLFACGRLKCSEPAHETMGFFRRAGIETRLVYVPGAGHTAWGTLADEVGAAFAWLVEGDPRWSGDGA